MKRTAVLLLNIVLAVLFVGGMLTAVGLGGEIRRLRRRADALPQGPPTGTEPDVLTARLGELPPAQPGFDLPEMFAPGLVLLHGVMTDDNGQNIVMAVWGENRQIARIGDTFHGYRILGIEGQSVRIRRRGRTELLQLHEDR